MKTAIGIVALASVVCIGCAVAAEDRSLNGMWHAVEIDGVAVAGPVFSYENTNDGAIVSGTGSCNRYSGRALVNGNKIDLTPLNSAGAAPTVGTQIYRWKCGPSTSNPMPTNYLPGTCRG